MKLMGQECPGLCALSQITNLIPKTNNLGSKGQYKPSKVR